MQITSAAALNLPESVARYVGDCPLHINSVGRSGATVVYIEKHGGLYFKIDSRGSLKSAADMQRFLHSKGMAAEIVYYESSDRDYLLSAAAEGECALSDKFISDPKRLTVMLAEAARELHDLDAFGCPNPNRSEHFLNEFDMSFSENAVLGNNICRFLNIQSTDEILKTVNECRNELKNDTVIHGDMCIPNFMFSDTGLSAFIDLSEGGIGDRHYDIFWVLWSMWYNFKTHAYTDLFLDSYGRDRLNINLIRACGCLCAF